MRGTDSPDVLSMQLLQLSVALRGETHSSIQLTTLVNKQLLIYTLAVRVQHSFGVVPQDTWFLLHLVQQRYAPTVFVCLIICIIITPKVINVYQN